jgi:hypothetical protein
MPVTQAFIDGGDWDTSKLSNISSGNAGAIAGDAAQLKFLFDKWLNHTNMTTEDCFNAYSNQYISNFGDAILVQNEVIWHAPRNNTNDDFDPYLYNSTAEPPNWRDALPFLSTPGTYPSNGWRCPSRRVSTCDTTDVAEVANVSQWAPYGSPVRYCLVEEVDIQVCRLQFSLPIAEAVLVCNAVKLLCMVFILWRCRGKYLVTLGDAIASFLQDPDPQTRERCLHSDQLMFSEWYWMDRQGDGEVIPEAFAPEPEEFQLSQHNWGDAVGKIRWFIVIIL